MKTCRNETHSEKARYPTDLTYAGIDICVNNLHT